MYFNLRMNLLACLVASFLPSLLTYLSSLIPYIGRCYRTLTGNFSKTTLEIIAHNLSGDIPNYDLCK